MKHWSDKPGYLLLLRQTARTVCNCYPLADDLHTTVTCVTCKSSTLCPSPTPKDAAALPLEWGQDRSAVCLCWAADHGDSSLMKQWQCNICITGSDQCSQATDTPISLCWPISPISDTHIGCSLIPCSKPNFLGPVQVLNWAANSYSERFAIWWQTCKSGWAGGLHSMFPVSDGVLFISVNAACSDSMHGNVGDGTQTSPTMTEK